MNSLKRIIRFVTKRYKRFVCAPDVPFGALLMLHSIDKPDNKQLWSNENLKFSPESLSALIEYGKKNNCHFVSIDEMVNAIRQKKYRRRMIAITIDDGYRNNYDLGLPVFERYDVPFCVNLTTNVMDGKMLYWWYLLEEILQNHDQVKLGDGRLILCRTKEEKEAAFHKISDVFLAMPQTNLNASFRSLFPDYDYNEYLGNDVLGMTWQQVKKLSTHPLVTLGNHTVSHPFLRNCTLDETYTEVSMAQEKILQNIGHHMHVFAYPYGSHTKEEKKLIQDMGFQCIQTVDWNLVTYGTDVFALPRLGINERDWKDVMDHIITRC